MAIDKALAQAEKLFEKRKFAEALEKYLEVNKADPNNEIVNNKLVRCYVELGKPQEAVEFIKKMALLASKGGRSQKAVALLKQAYQVNPNDLDLIHMLAEECEAAGKVQDANEYAGYLLAYYVPRKLFAKASEVCRQLVRLNRSNQEYKNAWLELILYSGSETTLLPALVGLCGPPGLVHEDFPQAGDAAQVNERAYELLELINDYLPANPFTCYGLAWINYKRGDITATFSYLHELIRRAPGFSMGHAFLARLLAQRDWRKETAYVFRHARDKVGGDKSSEVRALNGVLDQLLEEFPWLAEETEDSQKIINTENFQKNMAHKLGKGPEPVTAPPPPTSMPAPPPLPSPAMAAAPEKKSAEVGTSSIDVQFTPPASALTQTEIGLNPPPAPTLTPPPPVVAEPPASAAPAAPMELFGVDRQVTTPEPEKKNPAQTQTGLSANILADPTSSLEMREFKQTPTDSGQGGSAALLADLLAAQASPDPSDATAVMSPEAAAALAAEKPLNPIDLFSQPAAASQDEATRIVTMPSEPGPSSQDEATRIVARPVEPELQAQRPAVVFQPIPGAAPIAAKPSEPEKIDLGDDLLDGTTRMISGVMAGQPTAVLEPGTMREAPRPGERAQAPSPKIEPQLDEKTLILKGDCYLEEKKYHLARKAYRHALALGADEKSIREKLREIRKREMPDSFSSTQSSEDNKNISSEEILQRLERDFALDEFSAVTAEEKRELLESLSAVRAQIDLSPEPPDERTKLDLGIAYFEVGFFEEAEAYFQQIALSQDPALRVDAEYLLAKCYESSGRYAQALALLKRLGERRDCGEQEKIPVYYALGELLERMKQPDRARKYYERVAKLDRHYRNIQDKLKSN